MTLSDTATINVLIADCRPPLSRTVRPWLEDRQYAVHIEHNAERAVGAVPILLPDIILVNVALPDKHGLEVCRAVKSNPALGFIPILALIAPEADLSRAALDAGADDVLTRPLHQAQLLLRVNVLLRLKRRFDSLWTQNQSITRELKKRQDEVAPAQPDQRELSVLKDSIVRNVSHELKTPLLQVKSAVAMLADDARAASPTGVSVLADHATAATARLESVVNNITQLASSLKVKSEPFHLIDAINHAIRHIGRQWSSSGGVERIKAPTKELPVVIGDRAGVSQVLQQLLDNAIKFSPSGGVVEILVEPGDQNGKTVCVAVRDHGIGIPADKRDQIFQAFYQVDSSPTRPFGGTGVGLAVAKLLADSMSLTIQVESEPGVGSTFSFMLPVGAAHDLPPERDPLAGS